MSTDIDPRYAAIHAAVRAIPRGEVRSYAEVAHAAGLPGRARMVGRALAQTPDGMKLPWHRVCRSGGRIAFPAGSAEFAEQSRRLREEGLEVVDGRIRFKPVARDIDALLWAPPD